MAGYFRKTPKTTWRQPQANNVTNDDSAEPFQDLHIWALSIYVGSWPNIWVLTPRKGPLQFDINKIDTMPSSEKYGTRWTREELVLAFDLYCRVPFQQTKTSNPKVQDLAHILGRTPASVARKLGNFGAFDPELRKRGISGLVHASGLDREIWDEFNNDWNGLVYEAHKLRAMFGREDIHSEKFYRPNGPSEKMRETKVRVHQAFFRQVVLSSYNETCCITGIRIPECLIASHIMPWSANEETRTDPSNGLCLSATFDRLFDKGLITVTGDLKMVVSKILLCSKETPVQELVLRYHGENIILPQRFMPSTKFLKWHMETVFHG